MQVTKFENERRNTTTDSSDIKKKLREYYE